LFTGLIEAVCRVSSARRNAGSMDLTVDLGTLAGEAAIGDSIAVNGVCLTITRLKDALATFNVSGETLAKSALARLKTASPVNIERALRPTDRLGGHIVQGHIDGTATIKAIGKRGQFADIRFAADSQLLDQMVVKGSVAVDGVSLTIADMDGNSFRTALIPETLAKTTLGKAVIGDVVNIETDIIAKIIKKQLDKILPRRQELTIDKLKQLGF
jgi:riboflavin synthase